MLVIYLRGSPSVDGFPALVMRGGIVRSILRTDESICNPWLYVMASFSLFFLYGQRVMWISAIYAIIYGPSVFLQKARGGAALASCKRRVDKSRGEIS